MKIDANLELLPLFQPLSDLIFNPFYLLLSSARLLGFRVWECWCVYEDYSTRL